MTQLLEMTSLIEYEQFARNILESNFLPIVPNIGFGSLLDLIKVAAAFLENFIGD